VRHAAIQDEHAGQQRGDVNGDVSSSSASTSRAGTRAPGCPRPQIVGHEPGTDERYRQRAWLRPSTEAGRVEQVDHVSQRLVGRPRRGGRAARTSARRPVASIQLRARRRGVVPQPCLSAASPCASASRNRRTRGGPAVISVRRARGSLCPVRAPCRRRRSCRTPRLSE
jgi:hypothetical protein